MKRVNIISREIKNEQREIIQQAGILMRTAKSFAEANVATGRWAYTSKSKLKSFLNREAKLHRNMRVLQYIDANTPTTKEQILAVVKGKATTDLSYKVTDMIWGGMFKKVAAIFKGKSKTPFMFRIIGYAK